MKIKQIATAVSAVLLSSSVFAVQPSVVPDVKLFISGSSTQDKSIEAAVGSLCLPNSLDTFKDDSAKPGKAYTAYYCLMDNSTVPGLIKAGDPNQNPRNVLGRADLPVG